MTPIKPSETGPGCGPVWLIRKWVSRWLARPLIRGKPRAYRTAIVKLDRIGDAVLAVGAIRTILQQRGESECMLVVTSFAEALLAAEFPMTPRLVLPIEVGHKRLLREGEKARRLLREISCSEVICLRHQRSDWDELVLAWLGGRSTHLLDEVWAEGESAGRRTFRYAGGERTRFVSPETTDAAGCGELERHRQLLARVLDRPVAVAEILPRFERVGADAARGGIAVTPFGTATIRDFPIDLLRSALQAVRAGSAAAITFYGSPAQQPRLRAVVDALQAGGVANLQCAPPMGVVAFAAAIAAADLVVTIETATAHLAAAFDRPAVILIGGGHYGEFGPWSRSARQVWVTQPLDCFGCSWRCIFPAPYCLTQISADAVRAAVTEARQQGAIP